MFSQQQIGALKGQLDSRHVKHRAQAGRQLSYIEGWHAIDEANRIFGFDAWDRETVELRQLGDAREVDGKWRVAYMAKVRVTVRTSGELIPSTVVRDGCGYGSGIDRDPGSAHESAIKEAETDAMKRALMTFGNPFGLALYDKEQRNVGNGQITPLPSDLEPHDGIRNDTARYERLEADLKASKSVAAAKEFCIARKADIEALSPARQADLRKVYTFVVAALTPAKGEAA
jgi:DNA repair and recombination protein RAD52